jgi:hypothetical protein
VSKIPTSTANFRSRIGLHARCLNEYDVLGKDTKHMELKNIAAIFSAFDPASYKSLLIAPELD